MYYAKNYVRQAEKDLDRMEEQFKKWFGEDWHSMFYDFYDPVLVYECRERELLRTRLHKSGNRNALVQIQVHEVA